MLIILHFKRYFKEGFLGDAVWRALSREAIFFLAR